MDFLSGTEVLTSVIKYLKEKFVYNYFLHLLKFLIINVQKYIIYKIVNFISLYNKPMLFYQQYILTISTDSREKILCNVINM